MENHYIRVEDISAAVDFVTTLPYVGRNHIAMYDIYVPQAIEALTPFFQRTL